MSETPKLSIGVPSRNRQIYFQQTIRDLIADPRADIEFVFADNSDDPALMNDFMAGISDPRIRYIPSEDRCLPMEDNWERVMEASTGDWIVIIGDDDFVDTGLPDILAEIERRSPSAQALGWNRLTYNWPQSGQDIGNMGIELANEVVPYPRELLLRRIFKWEQARRVPTNVYSIYHAAIRRDLALAIKGRFGGRFFEHPVLDYEFGCKVAISARSLLYLKRPLSVLGVCSASNSAAASDFEKTLQNYKDLVAAYKGEDQSVWMDGFPFNSHLGIAGAVMGLQHWFKSKYDFPVNDWETGFVAALANDCNRASSPQGFALQTDLCRQALSMWKNGRYLPQFNPPYMARANAQAFTGFKDGKLYVDERIGGVETPAALFSAIRQIIDRPENIRYAIDRTEGAQRFSPAA